MSKTFETTPGVGETTPGVGFGSNAAETDTRRRRPVVSVGNLAMGGRGKTPLVIHLARMLLAAGERPAVLSRGYGRRRREDGVVIVSDGEHVLADLDRSGDEPLLIARAVPRARVLVCEERALAAALAERALDATVHLLDDGFQHRALARDVDLVVVTPGDLTDRRVPFGRLREPVRALARAHAVIVDGPAGGTLAPAYEGRTFWLRRALGAPVSLATGEDWNDLSQPVLALAGIAHPSRFYDGLVASGWTVAGTLSFGDHHRYAARDLARIDRAARDAGAGAVVTTMKDAMRLLPLRPFPMALAAVPLDVSVEPAATFQAWLLGRIAAAGVG